MLIIIILMVILIFILVIAVIIIYYFYSRILKRVLDLNIGDCAPRTLGHLL